jgi:hypothetical protein
VACGLKWTPVYNKIIFLKIFMAFKRHSVRAGMRMCEQAGEKWITLNAKDEL